VDECFTALLDFYKYNLVSLLVENLVLYIQNCSIFIAILLNVKIANPQAFRLAILTTFV